MSELTNDIQELIGFHGGSASMTGSRYICDPPPLDTDEDYLVHLHSIGEMSTLCTKLSDVGFVWDRGEEYEGQDVCGSAQFLSYRCGKLNLIITADDDFARRHRAATHVCKTLNLLEKTKRIMVFQAVLYGNSLFGGEV